ncbi:MAG: hypothetical protein AAF703_04565 [Cyanobacteria bacterium P01_D01_bin.105]
MEEWLRQLQQELEAVAQDSDKWLMDAFKETDQTISDTVDDIAEAIGPMVFELNQQVEASLDVTEIFIHQHLTPWVEEVTAPINNTVTPYLQDHPVCVGCKYYDGSAYGGNMLVCGMHPYGPDDETCQDWASVWVSKG